MFDVLINGLRLSSKTAESDHAICEPLKSRCESSRTDYWVTRGALQCILFSKVDSEHACHAVNSYASLLN